MNTLLATITCPGCHLSAKEIMPTDRCLIFYKCKGCGLELQPKPGDCCVFCSYADVCCPSKQIEKPN